MPNEWKEATVIPLHKKGKKSCCNNYRGISLLSVTSKVLSRLIFNRLTDHLGKILRDSQCGFRSSRSTIDMIFSLRQLIEKSMEQNTKLCISFIDISKAFDSVNREMLFKLLEKAKIPPSIRTIIKIMHEETFAAVKTENEISDNFQVCTGVKQGCVMAPALFLLYMHAITQITIDRCDAGVNIHFRSDLDMFSRRNLKAKSKIERKNIQDLMFADDAALIAETPEDLQHLLNTFVDVANQFGLKVNVDKTKCMFINCSSSNIYIDSTALGTVNVFKYLGNNIASDGSCDKEIDHRISAAARAFGSLYHRVWKSHELPIKTKIRVYETVVLSSLLYSTETLTLLERHKKRLNAFHQRCLRSMLHIKWQDRVANEDVLKRSNSMGIENIIKIRRLRWAGHLSRMPTNRLPQQIVLGELEKGKRNRCKPKKRWIDSIKDDLKSLNINIGEWRELAADRTAWREETKSKIMRNHEVDLEKRSERRIQTHEEEDTYSWKCPICDFTRDGRRGRQYVNSHISQTHKTRETLTPSTARRTASDIHCTICTQQCKSKAGLSSHMKHKHPNVVLEANLLKPIRQQRHPNPPDAITDFDQLTPAASSSNNQWSCLHCQKAFRSKAGLSSHYRSNKCGVQG